MTVATQRVAAHLRGAILGGLIGPGERVRQEDIAQQLGASRLPVREALGLFNYANVVASNSSMALNALTVNSVAVSGATQTIGVFQS